MTLDEAIEYLSKRSEEEYQAVKDYGELARYSRDRLNQEMYLRTREKFHKWSVSDMKVAKLLCELRMVKKNKSKWVYDGNGMDYNLGCWKCEKCGSNNTMIPAYIKMNGGIISHERINPSNYDGSNFCPNCGADMRTGGDE